MSGHRLGRGTEADEKEFKDRGLPPSWQPWNPWHHITFAYWALTFDYSKLDLTKKYASKPLQSHFWQIKTIELVVRFTLYESCLTLSFASV